MLAYLVVYRSAYSGLLIVYGSVLGYGYTPYLQKKFPISTYKVVVDNSG